MLLKLWKLVRENDAQDLIEYTLLLAFICLLCAGIMMGTGNGVSGIWGTSNATLATANTSASGSSPSASQTPPSGGGGGGSGDHHGDSGHDGPGR